MTKAQRNARARKISRAIDLICDSIVSHTAYCYGRAYQKKETPAFHRKTVREYCEILKTLSELY